MKLLTKLIPRVGEEEGPSWSCHSIRDPTDLLDPGRLDPAHAGLSWLLAITLSDGVHVLRKLVHKENWGSPHCEAPDPDMPKDRFS